RGWTRWLAQVAERFTVWAPTHPGFGRSGDADWMDGIDDLARFHLWFIDAAGLGRPHLLGHSIGGWTAAEMATMSPGSIARVVLVECGEQYRRHLPNARLTVLERCGHLPPIEQPDAFARLVLDFLGGDTRR